MSSNRGEDVDKRQLEQFLEEIARFRAAERSQRRLWRALGDSIGRNQALLAARKATLAPIVESLDSEVESDYDEDEEDAYSTVANSSESDDEEDIDAHQDLEQYSQLLHEYAESRDEEEEWIRDVELKLMGKVRDSLVNLMACQLVVKQHQPKAEREQEEKAQRRSSVVQAAVLETRRARAEQIRRQSEKANRKVQRAKARQLKAGRALVRALRQRRQARMEEKQGLKQRKKQGGWAELKKEAERELQRHLASLVQQVRI